MTFFIKYISNKKNIFMKYIKAYENFNYSPINEEENIVKNIAAIFSKKSRNTQIQEGIEIGKKLLENKEVIEELNKIDTSGIEPDDISTLEEIATGSDTKSIDSLASITESNEAKSLWEKLKSGIQKIIKIGSNALFILGNIATIVWTFTENAGAKKIYGGESGGNIQQSTMGLLVMFGCILLLFLYTFYKKGLIAKENSPVRKWF